MNTTLEMPVLKDEWLELETAVELIGQMIAYYVGRSAEETAKSIPNPQLLEEYEQRINELGQERLACYSHETDKMVQKAYGTYAPFLRSLSH